MIKLVMATHKWRRGAGNWRVDIWCRFQVWALWTVRQMPGRHMAGGRWVVF